MFQINMRPSVPLSFLIGIIAISYFGIEHTMLNLFLNPLGAFFVASGPVVWLNNFRQNLYKSVDNEDDGRSEDRRKIKNFLTFLGWPLLLAQGIAYLYGATALALVIQDIATCLICI